MARINIITDSSAYLPNPVFPGQDLVTVLPLTVKMGTATYSDSKDSKIFKRWFSGQAHRRSILNPPSVDDFCRLFSEVGKKHVDILTILHSGSLSPVYANACKAASIVKNSGAIIVVDSYTIGAGLGALVQIAAQAATKKMNITAISQLVRGMIPRIYTALFLPNLSYLSNSGFLDPAQASVSEMLGIIPFYILDSGNLVSVQKARNSRQLIDMIYEFVSEFSELSQIALLQGYPPYEQEMRSLRDRISNSHPKIPLFEHQLSLSMISLLGPNIFGVVAVEHSENDH